MTPDEERMLAELSEKKQREQDTNTGVLRLVPPQASPPPDPINITQMEQFLGDIKSGKIREFVFVGVLAENVAVAAICAPIKSSAWLVGHVSATLHLMNTRNWAG